MSGIRENIRRLFAERLRKAMDEALAEFTAEKLVKAIMHDMQKARIQITTAVLGIDNRWARWEVSKGSPLANFLEAQCQDELTRLAQDTVKEALADVLQPVSKTQRANIKKMFHYHLDWRLRDAVDNEAKRLAQDVATQLAHELTAEVRQEVLNLSREMVEADL